MKVLLAIVLLGVVASAYATIITSPVGYGYSSLGYGGYGGGYGYGLSRGLGWGGVSYGRSYNVMPSYGYSSYGGSYGW